MKNIIIAGEGSIDLICFKVIMFIFLYLLSFIGSYSVEYFRILRESMGDDNVNKIKIDKKKTILAAFPATLCSLVVFDRVTSINYELILLISFLNGFVSFNVMNKWIDNANSIKKFIIDLVRYLIDGK